MRREGKRVQTDEERLVESAIGGDAYAFEQLMGKHEARMYAVALRMCGNREDAQDSLQDAMLRIYKALGSFKGQSSFATWAYRITMNTCLDNLRRKKVRQAQSLDALLDAGYEVVGVFTQPDRPVGRGHRLAACPVKARQNATTFHMCCLLPCRNARQDHPWRMTHGSQTDLCSRENGELPEGSSPAVSHYLPCLAFH